MKTEYKKVLAEYFDLKDTKTLKVMVNVNESDSNSIVTSLTNKLYNMILDKVEDIDYGDIPDSKGDITKLARYEKIVDCVDILKSIIKEYKQPTQLIDEIDFAIKNVVTRRDLFKKGYYAKLELPMILYENTVLGIISSISLLISTTIEFVKSPKQDEFKTVFDSVSYKKAKEHILFSSLGKFNSACKDGSLDGAVNKVIMDNIKKLTGAEAGVIVMAATAIVIALNILPILREFTYFFYHSRTRVSDYFDMQADLLQMNAYSIESVKLKDPKEKEKIVRKQLNLADTFRKIADKFRVEFKTTDTKATAELVNSDKKYKIDDIVDVMPDSASSVLF